MSEENQGSNGSSNENANGNQGKGQVAYETYQKVLGSLKKKEQMLDALEAKAKELEANQLAEQGKYKEISEQLKAELKKKDDEFKKKESFFVKSNLKNTVAKYAKELGAIDQAVEDIFKVEDWSDVEFKEDYTVNEEQILTKVKDLTSKKPFYFKKQVNAPKDVVLGSGMSAGANETDVSKMTKDKLLEAYKKLSMK